MVKDPVEELQKLSRSARLRKYISRETMKIIDQTVDEIARRAQRTQLKKRVTNLSKWAQRCVEQILAYVNGKEVQETDGISTPHDFDWDAEEAQRLEKNIRENPEAEIPPRGKEG